MLDLQRTIRAGQKTTLVLRFLRSVATLVLMLRLERFVWAEPWWMVAMVALLCLKSSLLLGCG